MNNSGEVSAAASAAPPSDLRQRDFFEASPGNRAVLVIGSGRSGTSTLACALSVLGVELGRKLKAPTRKNPRGFYEEVHLLKLIKRVRRTLGLRPESVRLIDDHEWQDPRVYALRKQMVEQIRREFADAPVWGFKYGSNGRLLQFWLDLFATAGIKPAFVFAYRSPLSIARSRSRLDRRRGAQEKSDMEWAVHVIPVLRRLAGAPLVVVDYDRLLDNPADQLERISARLQLPRAADLPMRIDAFCNAFVDPKLRHTRFDRNTLYSDRSLNPIVREGALELDALAGDLISHDDPELLRRWQHLEDRLAMMAPCLRLTDSLTEQLRRARWWDLARPVRAALNAMPVFPGRSVLNANDTDYQPGYPYASSGSRNSAASRRLDSA